MAPLNGAFHHSPFWHSDAVRGPSTPSFDDLVGAGEYPKEPYPGDCRRLLRAGSERPGSCCAAGESDEIAASHTNPPLVGAGQGLWLNRATSDTPDEGPLATQSRSSNQHTTPSASALTPASLAGGIGPT